MVGVPTVLAYDSSDPFAVTASFDTGGDEPIVWVFARDLLLEGLQRPAGQGDVTVWPSIEDDGETIHVALSSPDGEAEFQALASQIERFLARTFATGADRRGTRSHRRRRRLRCAAQLTCAPPITVCRTGRAAPRCATRSASCAAFSTAISPHAPTPR